ncbi:MAG: sodium-dependent transporter [Oscillospiraceae bacterium]|nr:sodium-dependent transporter [Oscillospiraceae bacterium]
MSTKLNKSESKGGFSSKLGFILAAAGSAVGLGNIWRFPYLAAKYGGGIFLLVYIILTVTFGFTLMITEIAIGRRTGKSVIGAYADINKKFKPLGWLAAAVPAIILPYYCVIGGWVMKYVTVYLTGAGAEAAADKGAYFGNFIGQTGQPMIFFIIFILITAVVVMLGVEKGIEKVSKLLMPVLVLISLFIAIYSVTIDGAWDGFIYYIKPNFANFSIKTVVAAMGQLFYSMSLAMGIMITYGSYMRKEDNLEQSVRQIELFDTGIAFLAGMMVVPPVFAFAGGDPSKINSGPGLMFQTLPQVFGTMKGGNIIGLVFFTLVLLAALTSSISLMETIVSVVMEKFKVKRIPACLIVIVFSLVLGLVSVFGFSIWKNVQPFGQDDLLTFFDFLSNNIMMPIVALLTCILIGYVAKTTYVEEEVQINSPFKSKGMYRIMIKFVAPIFMVVIFLSSIFGYV